MALFFTSDHHFGHGGARGLFQRPFASTAEMDAATAARWGEVVGPQDQVWHLGDFAVRQRRAAAPSGLSGWLAGTPLT
jgi:calcineurin-like phosphoesterase family protein